MNILNGQRGKEIPNRQSYIFNNYINHQKLKNEKNSVYINVYCRFRPLTETEEEYEQEKKREMIKISSKNEIVLFPNNKSNLKENYIFDDLYNNDTSKTELYDNSCKKLINHAMNGYNSAIICYGQTNMGKTYTINEIISQIGKQIFDEIDLIEDFNNIFKVELGGFEIYKEQVNDLLDLINMNLDIRENKNYKRLFVDNLTFFTISDEEEYNDIMNKIMLKRNNLSLSMKEYTSRSNNIIVINIYRYSSEKKKLKSGSLYLVDLEGSEKISKNKIEGESHEEKKILNRSLSTLKSLIDVINFIKSEPSTQSNYNPYHESKLTEILHHCFGGNCFTSIFLNCCLSDLYFDETRNTLIFGQKVKNIQNYPIQNIEKNADKNPLVKEMIKLFMERFKNKSKRDEKNMAKKYENEILILKNIINKLREEIKSNIRENQELKNKIKKYEQQKMGIDKFKEENENLKKEKYELNTKIDILEAKLEQSENLIKNLKSENERMKNNEEEISKLNQKIKNLNKTIENFEKKERESKRTNRVNESKIKEMEKDLNIKDEKINELKKTNKELNKEFDDYKNENKSIIKDLKDELEQEKSQKEIEINKYNNALKKIKNKDKELEDKEDMIKDLSKEKIKNLNDIEMLKNENKQIKERIEGEKKKNRNFGE